VATLISMIRQACRGSRRATSRLVAAWVCWLAITCVVAVQNRGAVSAGGHPPAPAVAYYRIPALGTNVPLSGYVAEQVRRTLPGMAGDRRCAELYRDLAARGLLSGPDTPLTVPSTDNPSVRSEVSVVAPGWLVVPDAGLAMELPELCAAVISNRAGAEAAYLLEHGRDIPQATYATAVREMIVGEMIVVTPEQYYGLLRSSDQGVVDWFREAGPRLRWTGTAFSVP